MDINLYLISFLLRIFVVYIIMILLRVNFEAEVLLHRIKSLKLVKYNSGEWSEMTTFKRDFIFRDNVIEIVSKNVRKYRKLAGITQEQLALDIGVSNDFLRRFETTLGKEGMALNTLYKISIVLNVSMDKFFIE